MAWTFFVLAIIFCLIGLGHVTYNLDKPDMRKGKSGLTRAFLAGSEVVQPFAKYAIWSFGTGAVSFLIFAVANFMSFF